MEIPPPPPARPRAGAVRIRRPLSPAGSSWLRALGGRKALGTPDPRPLPRTAAKPGTPCRRARAGSGFRGAEREGAFLSKGTDVFANIYVRGLTRSSHSRPECDHSSPGGRAPRGRQAGLAARNSSARPLPPLVSQLPSPSGEAPFLSLDFLPRVNHHRSELPLSQAPKTPTQPCRKLPCHVLRDMPSPGTILLILEIAQGWVLFLVSSYRLKPTKSLA